LAGPHLISAQDGRTGQSAYLNIQVYPNGAPATRSNQLALSTHLLTFHAVAGQADPAEQRVTLTNTSNARLDWTAIAIADHNLSWLVIDNAKTGGRLDVKGTDTIGIGA